MKKSKITWVLFLITFLTTTLSGISVLRAQPGENISTDTFYDELAPYGQWVDDQEDGRVWIPNVERDFRPYATRGHWVVTDYGNTWVSDYSWGWAPFHYGRWRNHNRYGWVWIPGSEWGPAWVSWRSGGGYYGWAPLGPRVSVSIGINLPFNLWVFVPERHLCSPVVYSYYEPRPRIVNIYQRTTIINNIYRYNNRDYVYGPRRYDIERATQRPVQVYRVTDAGRPGNSVVRNGSVNIYRPQVNGRSNSSRDNGQTRGGYDNQNNQGRPDRANGGMVTRSADVPRDGQTASSNNDRGGFDRRNSNNGRGNTDRISASPDRFPGVQQADRTPAAEQNTPYRREGGYDRNVNTSQNNSSRPMPQNNRQREQQVERREIPQQQQSRGQSGGRNERTQQSRPEQSQQRDRGNNESNRRERPSRI